MPGDITGNTRVENIEFYEAHDPVWTANAAAIGLNPAQATQITTLTTAARTAYNAALTARNASKAATQSFYDAVQAMNVYGSGLISTIRAKAESTSDPTVYTKAQVPPKSNPTPAGPPTDATNLDAALQNDGTVKLTWNGTVRNGQFFSVRRKTTNSASWVNLGSVRAKSFLDDGIVQGTVSAIYQVFAHRGEQVSNGSEPVTVLFGSQLAA